MIEPAPPVTRSLGDFVVGLSPSAVPADVLHLAKRCLLDYLGVGLAGSTEDAARIARRSSRRWGADGTAAVLGSSTRVAAPLAALANGVAAHVLDYDDTYNPGTTTVHGSAVTWSAVLATAAWRRTTGAAALLAFVAGFETAVRVALAAGPSQYDAGWHVTGTVGHVGAAAAAARVLGADRDQATAALGIGATQAAGLKGVYGSMGKPLHAGKAAMDGLLSASLGVDGFTSSPTAIEGHRGFLHLFSADPDPGRALEGLGDEWTLRDNGFKAYACGSLTHPCIDAILSLRAEHALVPADVTRIDALVHDYVITTTGRPDPADGLEAKFSIHHCAAVALVDGAARLAQFSDSRARDPEVLDVRDRVRVQHDPTQQKDSATVRITLQGGRLLERHVDHNKGTPGNPMSDAELEAKFLDLAGAVVGARVAQGLVDLCWEIEQVEDVTDLLATATDGAPA